MVKQNQNSSCGNVERFLGGSTLGKALNPGTSLIEYIQEWSQGSQLEMF